MRLRNVRCRLHEARFVVNRERARGSRIIAVTMKLWHAVVLGTLALASGCFEDPLPPIESGSSGSGESGTTAVPTTTAPDPDSTSGPTTSEPGSSGPDDTTGEPPLACVEAVLDPPLGAGVAEVDTAPAGDDTSGSCGGDGSPDAAYQWDVPYDGFFVLDTEGSDFDTLLYVLDDCGGSELACNDNAEGSVSSQVVAPFVMGDRVVVVVDGNAGESGQARLNINPVECPSADLTGQVLPQELSNVAGSSDHGGNCGGDGNPERAFRWQAPQDGLYAFIADSDAFEPAIYLEEGPICGGPELACNPPAFGHTEVMRVLEAGEPVTVIVDSAGGAGEFDVNIVQIGDPCPAAPLDDTIVADIGDFTNTMSSSCGPSGFMDGPTFSPHADATYAWTSPGMAGSNSGCDIIVTAGFPVALSLQAGTCDGPEVQCAEGMFEEATGTYTATVSVGHIPPTEFTVAVTPRAEPFLWVGGSGFTLEVVCFAVA